MASLPALSMTERAGDGSRARRVSPRSGHLIHLGPAHQVHFFMDCDYNISMSTRLRRSPVSHHRIRRFFMFLRIVVKSSSP
jgi:hypothetical protein